MRIDMPEILARMKEYRQEGLIHHISFLANPEQLTPKMIQALVECQTDSYTISLDGLKEVNDRMRGAGNFDMATAAIRNLHEAGIRVPVKFTMTRENRHQLKETILLALELGCDGFGIGQLALQGGGYLNAQLALSATEYRAFLWNISEIVQTLPEKYFNFACGLLHRYYALIEMIYREENRLSEFEMLCRRFPEPEDFLDGFGSGPRRKLPEYFDPMCVSFYVWPDGEVNGGNRWTPRLGWVPRNTFMELYELSPVYDDIKNGITPEIRTQITEKAAAVCARCMHREKCSRVVQIFSAADKKHNGLRNFGMQTLYPSDCWILEREFQETMVFSEV